MTTRDEKIAAAASDMGFDEAEHLLEFLEGQGLTVQLKDEEDKTEGLIERLNDSLCTLLHSGGEVGEHSPEKHLELFHAHCLKAPERRRAFIERAALAFATHPQFNTFQDASGGLRAEPWLLNPAHAVKEAVSLWEAIEKALTE